MDNTANDINDAGVIRQVLEGDVNAFELLMARYQGHVARIVTKHVPGDSAEEVAHETFVRAYQFLGSYRGDKPFEHWLSTIAVRCCYDFWREKYRNREKPAGAMAEDCDAWVNKPLSERSQASFAEQGQRNEAANLLHWALDSLSAEDRMVLTLTYLEGYSVAEAAELLEWSIPNVKVRSFRARRKLRKILLRAMRWD
jgi:RNA polymerase sigma-70 factor (ECF subfamily)